MATIIKHNRAYFKNRCCQKYLDVYGRPSSKIFQLGNNEAGIAQLVQVLKEIQPELIVLEATGGIKIDAAVKHSHWQSQTAD